MSYTPYILNVVIILGGPDVKTYDEVVLFHLISLTIFRDLINLVSHVIGVNSPVFFFFNLSSDNSDLLT